VRTWLKDSDSQVFRLFGYAGTGKTELAQHMGDLVEGKVLYGAFTGKAAHVMRQRGCRSASTIHKLIYNPKDKGRSRLLELQKELTDLNLGVEPHDTLLRKSIHELELMIREEKEALKRPYFALNPDSEVRRADLLVIDEVSMVDQRMGEDLLSFGTKVLVIGDPFQLPPVRGEGYFTGEEPDVMLTEIHRQAEGNPIIDLATTVRLGHTLKQGQYGDSIVMDWKDIEAKTALAADQVLVGTNKLRRGTNRRMRELLGFDGDMPLDGDRLVCLRNDHKEGLLNGAIWNVVGDSVQLTEDYIHLDVASEDGKDNLDLTVHACHFCGLVPEYWNRKKAQEFDYGYALTCHKAQGSQWPHVLVFDQSKSFRQHAQRWLYTAITRASERITVVQ